MSFGFLAPLPIRLGGSATEGWTSQQQSRVAADMCAAWRTAPLAVLTLSTTGLNAAISSYHGRNGNGPEHAPTVVGVVGSAATIEWEAGYLDAFEVMQPWRITAVEVAAHHVAGKSVMVYQNADPTSVKVFLETLDAAAAYAEAEAPVTVVVYGTWGPDRQIGDYDGATDKTDSLTEGNLSYAYGWYRILQDSRGSLYSRESDTLVDVENMALARLFGTLSRSAEKIETNSLPGTADEKLEEWAQILGVPFRGSDQRWQIRQKCAAKLAAATDATLAIVDDATRELLGDTLVEIHRQYGATLSSPPSQTYWPTINPGPSSLSLGGGAWLSERAHYYVEVSNVSRLDPADFVRLVQVDLFSLLDARLPAWATFDWSLSAGFILDISQLDFDGID